MVKKKLVFSSFNELINYNVLYIKGEVRKSVYNYDPFSSDATEKDLPFFRELINKLVEINQLGLLTITGQGLYNDNEVKQKPYLEGYLQRNKLESFLSVIKQDPYLQYIIYYPDGTRENNIPLWEINSYGDRAVILTREFYNGRWNSYTSRRDNPLQHFEDFFDLDLVKDCVRVFLSMREFCEPNGIQVYCQEDYFYNKIIEALKFKRVKLKLLPDESLGTVSVSFTSEFGKSRKALNNEIRYLHTFKQKK